MLHLHPRNKDSHTAVTTVKWLSQLFGLLRSAGFQTLVEAQRG